MIPGAISSSCRQLFACASILLLFGCSTIPSGGPEPAAPDSAEWEQLSLPPDLPGLDAAVALASGVEYLHYYGLPGVYPAFHLFVVDSSAGARVAPLPAFKWGKVPASVLAQIGGTALVNGSPFRWQGIPFIGPREPAALWRPHGYPYNQPQIDYGYLSFDGVSYRISRRALADSDWIIGGYLPFLEAGTNTGIHGQRNARTAVALVSDGRLLVVVVEAHPSVSQGLTSRELGELLLLYGASDAINLDGGNSSVLALKDPDTGMAVTVYRGGRRILPLFLAVYPAP